LRDSPGAGASECQLAQQPDVGSPLVCRRPITPSTRPIGAKHHLAPAATSALHFSNDRRLRGSAPRTIVTAVPAHAGRQSHSRTVIGRPGSSPWSAGQRSRDPLPRNHRYALGYHKLEDRSARTSRNQSVRTVPAERRTARPPPPRTAGQATQRTGATFFLCLHLLHFRPCVLELGFVPGLTDAWENVLLLFPDMNFEARVHGSRIFSAVTRSLEWSYLRGRRRSRQSPS
jgi:hypothetical protein